MKFEISWRYGYNDCGASFTIRATDADGEFVNSASATVREHVFCPSIHRWKKALTEVCREVGMPRGAILSILDSGRPYYSGSEDPHWMR